MKKLTDYISEAEQELAEKAVSQQQQKFMGMVHAMQKGEKIKGASPELKKVARTMGKKDVEDYASTKHKGLPKKVDEGFDDSPAAGAITRRIMMQRLDLLEKYGPAKVLAAIDEVADFVGDVEEIGSSDVSGWVRQVEQHLSGMGESALDEVSLGDYAKKAKLNQALSKMEKGLGYPGDHDAKIARREKGIERAKARMSTAPKASAPAPADRAELQAKLANLEKQFDPSYEYSDDYTFWGQQRDIKNSIQSLKRQLANLGEAVTESAVLDESGQTIGHILSRFKHEVRNFRETGNLDNDLYDALYDYYSDHGEMPYGVAKARTGDPHNWISDKLHQHLHAGDIDEAASMVDIPAYKRKHSSRLGNFPASVPMDTPTSRVRPETVPAVARKAAGQDFPVTTAQVADTSDKLTSMDTLRKMAGLPPRA